MKVFSVTGITKSGKTATIELIIKELITRGYTVGTVKEIHNEEFRMDTEGKNTYRHRQAGALTVTALGYHETDVMYPYKMNVYQLLKHYTEDYVILEGVDYINVPRIAVAHNREELVIDDRTFLISGVITNTVKGDIDGIPLISAKDNVSKIADIIIAKVPPLMPDVDVNCCGECGTSCRELLSGYLRGNAIINDCVLNQNKVCLSIDGKKVEIVPFVDKILYNTVKGIVKELKGYREDAEIVIKL